MKKLITALLAIVLVFAFTACNNNGGDDSAEETENLSKVSEFTFVVNGGFNKSLQTVCRSGNCFNNGTAKFCGKSISINLVAFLLANIALIQSNNNRNAKF